MAFRPGKILAVLLVPAAVYGVAKGVMYFNAKQAADDFVEAARPHAEVRYTDISTDLTGGVTYKGITASPYGESESITVDAVRISSSDPLAFIKTAEWLPGEKKLPDSVSFQIMGMHVPMSLAEGSMLDQPAIPAMAVEGDEQSSLCAGGLDINARLLGAMGFDEMNMDMDVNYTLNEAQRTLDVSISSELHDVQSFQVSATFTDVDVQTLSNGAPPAFNLGGFTVATTVLPQFGHRALKTCAAGTGKTVQEWSAMLADIDEQRLQLAGLTLGDGLKRALRTFYNDWGEVEVKASPKQPVGVLSLAFLPPEQLVRTLSVDMRLNGKPVGDTSFTWVQPDNQQLSALFGMQQPGGAPAAAKPAEQPRRILVRREYENVPVARLGEFIDHQVQLKPRGQPMREGKLKGVRNALAEVEQTLHGGKYTVYVPLADIVTAQALVQREVKPVQ